MAIPTFSAGQTPSAAQLNAALNAAFPVGIDAWTAYTPVWSSLGTLPVLGNGTATGQYWKCGRTVISKGLITIGSTTTFGTGAYTLSLPVLAAGTEPGAMGLGPVGCYDTSAGTRFVRQSSLAAATNVLLVAEAGTLVTATSPMTWATGDYFVWKFIYESAA